MRSHPAEYEMVSPGTLQGVLRLMDSEPGQWLPVAGATEVMVLFSAGKLDARRLVNLWNLPELREIREDAGSLTLGGGCTFSAIRECAAVQRHFPLLAQAASWTGASRIRIGRHWRETWRMPRLRRIRLRRCWRTTRNWSWCRRGERGGWRTGIFTLAIRELRSSRES